MNNTGLSKLSRIVQALNHPVRAQVLKIAFDYPGIPIDEVRGLIECKKIQDHFKILVEADLLDVFAQAGTRHTYRLKPAKNYNAVVSTINAIAINLDPLPAAALN